MGTWEIYGSLIRILLCRTHRSLRPSSRLLSLLALLFIGQINQSSNNSPPGSQKQVACTSATPGVKRWENKQTTRPVSQTHELTFTPPFSAFNPPQTPTSVHGRCSGHPSRNFGVDWRVFEAGRRPVGWRGCSLLSVHRESAGWGWSRYLVAGLALFKLGRIGVADGPEARPHGWGVGVLRRGGLGLGAQWVAQRVVE